MRSVLNPKTKKYGYLNNVNVVHSCVDGVDMMTRIRLVPPWVKSALSVMVQFTLQTKEHEKENAKEKHIHDIGYR